MTNLTAGLNRNISYSGPNGTTPWLLCGFPYLRMILKQHGLFFVFATLNSLNQFLGVCGYISHDNLTWTIQTLQAERFLCVQYKIFDCFSLIIGVFLWTSFTKPHENVQVLSVAAYFWLTFNKSEHFHDLKAFSCANVIYLRAVNCLWTLANSCRGKFFC